MRLWFDKFKIFIFNLVHGQNVDKKKLYKGYMLTMLGVSLIVGTAIPILKKDQQAHTYEAWDYSSKRGI